MTSSMRRVIVAASVADFMALTMAGSTTPLSNMFSTFSVKTFAPMKGPSVFSWLP